MKQLLASWKNYLRETSEVQRFLSDQSKPLHSIVFYAESSVYYQYYKDYIDYLLSNYNVPISYLTSDPDDRLFKETRTNLHVFYVKTLLSVVFSKLAAKALIIATPDLGKFAIKRAAAPTHHIYAFRGVASTHYGYRLGAFDNYDSLLCIGQYQIDEVRKTEELYGLPRKELILTGYPLIESIYKDHLEFEKKAPKNERPVVLIAPTWSPFHPQVSILGSCIQPMIESLAKCNYEIWIRPHPEYARRFGEQLQKLQSMMKGVSTLTFEVNTNSFELLHRADVLITDYSAISMDYVLGTERPILFIDTQPRLDNPEWERIGLTPVENTFRDKLGERLKPDNMQEVPAAIERLLARKDSFRKDLPQMRNSLIANWMHSAKVGGDYIYSLATKS
ncbi:MAG: CDP-glycerol glycerophosphotransferase family protein [Candidatus Obscuribacterales bacterium]|nr:CDP-glycerol glycerophosphotransferase family protein [Candidatus Obscuribacterales bacterium]